VSRELHVVTGAFGYSGRSIAQLLLGAGHRVRTLTNSPLRPHPFGDTIEVRGLDFRDPDRLADSLDGADVLYNTYWVRFNHKTSHSRRPWKTPEFSFLLRVRRGSNA